MCGREYNPNPRNRPVDVVRTFPRSRGRDERITENPNSNPEFQANVVPFFRFREDQYEETGNQTQRNRACNERYGVNAVQGNVCSNSIACNIPARRKQKGGKPHYDPHMRTAKVHLEHESKYYQGDRGQLGPMKGSVGYHQSRKVDPYWVKEAKQTVSSCRQGHYKKYQRAPCNYTWANAGLNYISPERYDGYQRLYIRG